MIGDNDFIFILWLLRNTPADSSRLAEAAAYCLYHDDVDLIRVLARLNLLSAEQRTEALRGLGSAFEKSNWSNPAVVGDLLQAMPAERLLEFCAHASKAVRDAAGNENPRSRYAESTLHAQGGLGRILSAHDAHMQRRVALKEVRPDRTHDPQTMKRFLREARIAAQLEHPNIVPAYDLSAGSNGVDPFYTMRFITGSSLEERIQQYHVRREAGTADFMEFRYLLRALVEVCWAVSLAHSKKIIHRDLKPANVVLGEFGEVYLVDWGLAKFIGEQEDDEGSAGDTAADSSNVDLTESTKTGSVIGTPAFMAPEQALGRVRELDDLADVYGLGAVLFSILTGRAPHKFAPGISFPEALRQIAASPAPDARGVDSSVSPALAAIASKAMAPQPKDRYPSADALGKDIHRWLAGEPVHAYPEPWSQRLRRFIMRNALLTQSVSSAIVLIVVVCIILTAHSWVSLHLVRVLGLSAVENDARDASTSLQHRLVQAHADAIFLKNATEARHLLLPNHVHLDPKKDALYRREMEMVNEWFLRSHLYFQATLYWSMANGGGPLSETVRTQSGQAEVLSTSNFKDRKPAYPPPPELIRQILVLKPGDVTATPVRLTQTPAGQSIYILQFGSPIYDDPSGVIIGAAIGTVNMADMIGRPDHPRAEDAHLFVVDGDGMVLVQQGRSTKDASRQQINELAPAVAEGLAAAAGNHTVSSDNELFALRRISLDPNRDTPAVWVIIAAPTGANVHLWRRYFNMTLGVCLAMVTAALLMGWSFLRVLTRPEWNPHQQRNAAHSIAELVATLPASRKSP